MPDYANFRQSVRAARGMRGALELKIYDINKYASAYDGIGLPCVVFDALGEGLEPVRVYANPAGALYERERMGRSAGRRETDSPEAYRRAFYTYLRAFAAGREKTGTFVPESPWTDAAHCCRLEDGLCLCIFFSLERTGAAPDDDQLRQLKLYRIADHAGVFSVSLGAGCELQFGNDKLFRIVGYPEEVLRAPGGGGCLRMICREDRKRVSALVRRAVENGELCAEWVMRVRTAAGAVKYLWVSGAIERGGPSVLLSGAVVDITDQKNAEAQYERKAERADYDEMSGLLNHSAAIRATESCLRSGRPGTHYALFMLDIDNFKSVNDVFGHKRGDAAIVAVADTLRRVFCSRDILGRVGGDEFMILMRNVRSEEDVRKKAGELVEAMQFTYTSGDKSVSFGASIGVLLVDAGGYVFEQLYEKADRALYRAKKAGKNRFEIVRAEDETRGESSRPDDNALTVVQLNALLEYMDAGVLLVEAGEKLRTIYVSKSYYKMCGISEGAPARFTDPLERVFPEDRRELESHVRLALRSGGGVDSSYRVTTAAGAVNWRHIRAVPIPYEQSANPVLIAVLFDVTRQRRMEQILAETRRPQGGAPGVSVDSILVVDDVRVNRQILVKLLSDEYKLLEAENGFEALEILRRYAGQISAVLLDLKMPVMDGFAFLEAKEKIPQAADVPVIVVTGDEKSEVRALQMGAWDFVTKPLNPVLLKLRLDNVIARSRMGMYAQLKYLAEYDALTDIYNKEHFFDVTREMLLANPDTSFVMCRFDINRFNLVNAYFGKDEGDLLLRSIAHMLRSQLSGREKCTFGRIGADVFACCFPYRDEEQFREIALSSRETTAAYNRGYDILPTFGFCRIADNTLPPETSFDRASLAAKTRKEDYVNNYAVYAEHMGEQLRREQEIVNSMSAALENEQFEVFFQPQIDLRTGACAGAEALVRWQHPTNGLVYPARFVPLFERNGFVEKLDLYMWRRVCRYLRRWLNMGLEPLPVSVNVSRVNLYRPDFSAAFPAVLKEYDIPAGLVQLELTESAYAEDPQITQKAVTALRAQGFTVVMDDFGSGYSALNLLKDITVDKLKIDMHYLENSEDPEKGRSVVAAVLNMVKTLGIPTVVEGVETKAQALFLSRIGCEYAQGFYYSKPMAAEAYEVYQRQQRRG